MTGSLATCALWLLGATSVVAQIAPLSGVSLQTKLPYVKNRFIIEFNSPSDLPQPGGPQSRSLHESVYASLKERAFLFEIDHEYDATGLFIGAAITLNNPNDAKAVAALPGIVAIRPVREMKIATPVPAQIIRDLSISDSPDTESIHVMTGVDKLHAQGITGEGIKIGIIDSGIDYTHPLLGGGFGPGYKVVGGYDFVGDAFNGSNTPIPDKDPLDQCNGMFPLEGPGHGTHVAGIIGANPGNEFNISGVAYDALLSAYRVFGCSGTVTDDIIVAALLRGVNDGNDILTLSLGSPGGWTESSSSVVASRIAASGKIVTLAMGNNGASGSWYGSSPGNAINGIAVASVENTVIPLQQAIVNGVEHNPIAYYSFSPLPVQGVLPIYATSDDTTATADACSPLPAATPDLSRFVVIIRRGGCDFVTKLKNAADKRAKVALIYDDGKNFDGIVVGNYTAALVQAADGEFLVKEFVAGAPVTLAFPQTGGLVNFPNPKGGLVSDFSSYGPSDDLFFKPSVAAPGGNILSTLPVPLGSFGVQSGTSMATPYVAGSSALLFQAKGKSPSIATAARTIFETTAKSVPSSQKSSDPPHTLTQQGAGLIQVYNAIHYQTVVTPGELILNDTANFRGSHLIYVTNSAFSLQTYTVTHVPAATAVTVGRFSIWPNLGPIPLNNQYATVTFTQSRFTLPPLATIILGVTIDPPSGVDPTTFPVYSGFIQIDSDTESLHVPYLGLAASLIDKQVVDNTSQFFGVKLPAVLDSTRNVQSGPVNYTFANGDVPTLLVRLVFGTPVYRVDLVTFDADFTSTLNRRAVGPVEDKKGTFSFPQGPDETAPPSAQTIGPIVELSYATRNDEGPQGNGYNAFTMSTPTFANGTTIPNGSYRLLLRALRVTGDPKNETQYESWLSPIINILA